MVFIFETKIGYANALSLGTKAANKKETTTLESAVLIKEKSSVTCVVG